MIPDPIERGEARAEREFDERSLPGGKMRCHCGAVFDPETEGGTTSPDPYAMPVCPACFEEAYLFFKRRDLIARLAKRRDAMLPPGVIVNPAWLAAGPGSEVEIHINPGALA